VTYEFDSIFAGSRCSTQYRVFDRKPTRVTGYLASRVMISLQGEPVAVLCNALCWHLPREAREPVSRRPV